MSNEKYGRSIPDDMYLETLLSKMQTQIDSQRNKNRKAYGEDGMKSLVLDELDDLEIYSEDIDDIFSRLEF